MHLFINANEGVLWPRYVSYHKERTILIVALAVLASAGKQLRIECARQTLH